MILLPPRSTLFPYTTLFRSLHHARPERPVAQQRRRHHVPPAGLGDQVARDLAARERPVREVPQDRKSTRLNSSHANISYAVFCLKKKYSTHITITAAKPSRS